MKERSLNSVLQEVSNRQTTELQEFQLISLSGRDSRKFLNNFCSAKTDQLAETDVTEGFLLDVKGKVLTLATIFYDGQDLFLLSIGRPQADVLKHLEHYVITEDVEVKVVGDAAVFWVPPLEEGESDGRQAAADGSPSPFIKKVQRVVLDSGENEDSGPACCWELETNFGSGSRLLLEAGENRVWRTKLGGTRESASKVSDSFAVQRIENGFPVSGAEVDPSVLPQELDRDQASINFEKGCYLGQETVARLDAMGSVNWKIVRFRVESLPESLGMEVDQENGLIRDLWECRDGQKVIGKLTSIAPCADTQGWVGLARIRTKVTMDSGSWVFEKAGEGQTLKVTF